MALERELAKQRELEAERRRVAEMQRRQLEQEQFSVFEEMIRRQDHERERQRVLREFGTPTSPPTDTPLIPGIQGPPPPPYSESPTPPQSPQYPSTNHSTPSAPATPAPRPTFDRSLKPGTNSKASVVRYIRSD